MADDIVLAGGQTRLAECLLHALLVLLILGKGSDDAADKMGWLSFLLIYDEFIKFLVNILFLPIKVR